MDFNAISKLTDLKLNKRFAEISRDLIRTPETVKEYAEAFNRYWETRYSLRESDPETYKEIENSKYHNS